VIKNKSENESAEARLIAGIFRYVYTDMLIVLHKTIRYAC